MTELAKEAARGWAWRNVQFLPHDRVVADVAGIFGVEHAIGANVPEQVYPSYPGLVIAFGRAQSMLWGFPLAMTGKRGQPRKPKPVNNTREDKLGTAFWRDSFTRRRCLIPVTAWAEAEGERGRMTRTWHYLPDEEPFAVAGVWRPTAEWGDAYSMVMVDGCEAMAAIHDRMPVVIRRSDWATWTDGSPVEAIRWCQPWAAELMIERTEEPWASRSAANSKLASGTDRLF